MNNLTIEQDNLKVTVEMKGEAANWPARDAMIQVFDAIIAFHYRYGILEEMADLEKANNGESDGV